MNDELKKELDLQMAIASLRKIAELDTAESIVEYAAGLGRARGIAKGTLIALGLDYQGAVS